METEQKIFTRKDLIAVTNCPPYKIAYYTQCGYLPIYRKSLGSGYPILYLPEAVDVIRARMGLTKASDSISYLANGLR